MTGGTNKQLPPPSKKGSQNLPSLDVKQFIPLSFQSKNGNAAIPNASLIYGVASAALMAICLYFLFTGMWLTGLLLLLPAGCLLGFALHFLKHSL